HAQPLGFRYRAPAAALYNLRIFLNGTIERLNRARSEGRITRARHGDRTRCRVEAVAPFSRWPEQIERRCRFLTEGGARKCSGAGESRKATDEFATRKESPCRVVLCAVRLVPQPGPHRIVRRRTRRRYCDRDIDK